jgi:hypothetical protein
MIVVSKRNTSFVAKPHQMPSAKPKASSASWPQPMPFAKPYHTPSAKANASSVSKPHFGFAEGV